MYVSLRSFFLSKQLIKNHLKINIRFAFIFKIGLIITAGGVYFILRHKGAIKMLRFGLWPRFLYSVSREMSECGQVGLISVLILLVQALKRDKNNLLSRDPPAGGILDAFSLV